MVAGQRVMILVTEWLVYPLIVVLLAVTLYLIPSWKLDGAMLEVPAAGDLLMSLWMVIPVLVFAFCINSFTNSTLSKITPWHARVRCGNNLCSIGLYFEV